MDDKRRFRNRLCILQSIDKCEVSTLSEKQWAALRDNPLLGYLRLDDHGEHVVWQAILNREPSG